MAGRESGYRNRLFRAVHAEAAKRGIEHADLRDVPQVRSLAEATDMQLAGLYRQWTGRRLRQRLTRGAPTGANAVSIVSGEELVALEIEFSKRQLGDDGKSAFIRRQLRGRGEIRTHRDWAQVFYGLRAMNRREKL